MLRDPLIALAAYQAGLGTRSQEDNERGRYRGMRDITALATITPDKLTNLRLAVVGQLYIILHYLGG
jgi:hypothetical protein